MLNYFVNAEEIFYNVYACVHVYMCILEFLPGFAREVGIRLSDSGTGTLTFTAIFQTVSPNSNTYFVLERTPLCVCYVNVYQFLQES